ncbi:site-2 protease family protein [Arthrobacter sp. NEB 688]|uniref:site-2 protease family protein n=1 Tax=Arthrobacter sp. NEB 688 TaxID=904039 RepID=UPI001565EB0F|nr:site-2 protease family protein [Arthrobacter sp. NEB 688]QKE84778.1 peptidase M50 [Arthrobacter sp. NEB 688]
MSTSPPAPAGSVRLGRVATVPVYLDRTWLILAVVVAFQGYRAGSVNGPTYGVAYAAWLVLAILVAVLGHEVGHALSARRLGFHVHQVVATVWGGHTSYDATGATPGRTAVVALAGPLVNAVLAAVGLGIGWTQDGDVGQFAWSFGFLNALLAVFNLLPGLPLDGGAALQSLVWAVTGRRDLGLSVAGWVGRLVALGIVVWFLVLPLVQGLSPDVFDLVIGLVMAWVLWSGATAGLRRAAVERLLDTVRVGDAAEPVVVLPPETPLAVAREHPALVVVPDETGRPTLVLRTVPLDVPPTTAIGALVQRVPDGNLVEAEPGDELGRALRAMATSGVDVVVLTRAGAPWGLLGPAGIDAAAGRVRRRT